MFILSFEITIVFKFLVIIVLLVLLQLCSVGASHVQRSVVSIRTRLPEGFFGDNHYCAGTIIDGYFILTAAHCVSDEGMAARKPRDLLVVIGTVNRLTPTEHTKQLVVQRIYIHDEYPLLNKHDIAVLQMRERIDSTITDKMEMATGPPSPGAVCRIAGWGRVYKSGPLATTLLESDITISSPEECKEISEKYSEDNGVICATNAFPKVCNGDAGGPLICNNKLTGVITWVVGCETDGYPSLFADINYHQKWIESVLSVTSKPNVEKNISVMLLLFVFLMR